MKQCALESLTERSFHLDWQRIFFLVRRLPHPCARGRSFASYVHVSKSCHTDADICEEWQPDDWSDSEGEDEVGSDPIQVLEKKLAATQKQLEHYRIFAGSVLAGSPGASSSGSKPAQRDDDTHYFDSYAENGMHTSFPFLP